MHLESSTSSPAPRDLRRFALTLGAAFVVLAGVAWWRGRVGTAAVLGALGGALVVSGLLVQGRLGPVYRGWMALALAISRVTTPVFMGLLYFGIFTPLGVAMRLLGRRPLVRRREASTFWVDRPAGARRSDLRRQF